MDWKRVAGDESVLKIGGLRSLPVNVSRVNMSSLDYSIQIYRQCFHKILNSNLFLWYCLWNLTVNLLNKTLLKWRVFMYLYAWIAIWIPTDFVQKEYYPIISLHKRVPVIFHSTFVDSFTLSDDNVNKKCLGNKVHCR